MIRLPVTFAAVGLLTRMWFLLDVVPVAIHLIR